MSLLQHTMLPVLTGKHEATIKSYREVENMQGGYIEVILKLEDRDLTYCIFPSQLDYITSTLRRQFGMQDETVTLEDMLVKGETTKFNVWFSYNQDYGRMNVAFHEPVSVTEEEAVEL